MEVPLQDRKGNHKLDSLQQKANKMKVYVSDIGMDVLVQYSVNSDVGFEHF